MEKDERIGIMEKILEMNSLVYQLITDPYGAEPKDVIRDIEDISKDVVEMLKEKFFGCGENIIVIKNDCR